MDYKALLNKQINDMRPSPTFAVAAKANARRAAKQEVFDFSVGQPAEPTPEYVRLALIDMIRKNDQWATMSKYSPVNGLPVLKDAIVAKFQDENSIDYKPGEILVTNGGKQAIFNAFAVTLQKGDKVLLPEPSWVSYADMVKWQGAEPVGIPTKEDFKFTAEALEMKLAFDSKIKWIVLNSPSNPTGATYTLDELKAIADVVLRVNKLREEHKEAPLMVMSDDIYEHMVYDKGYVNKPGDPSAISNNIIMANPDMKPYTLIVNGVAKAFAMTGWRVGYAAGPKELVDKMGDFQGLTTSGVSAISQLAAAAALSKDKKAEREGFFDAQRKAYLERRSKVKELVNKIPGLSFTPTPGAFYAMVDCTDVARTAGGTHKLANQLIDEYGVATVPGDDFYVDPKGQNRSFLRMSYATAIETIEKGIAALGQAAHAILPDGAERKSPGR